MDYFAIAIVLFVDIFLLIGFYKLAGKYVTWRREKNEKEN